MISWKASWADDRFLMSRRLDRQCDPKKPVSPSAHRRFPEESPLSWSLDHLSANFFLFISGRHESDPKTGKWGILQLEYISFILHLLGSHRSF